MPRRPLCALQSFAQPIAIFGAAGGVVDLVETWLTRVILCSKWTTSSALATLGHQAASMQDWTSNSMSLEPRLLGDEPTLRPKWLISSSGLLAALAASVALPASSWALARAAQQALVGSTWSLALKERFEAFKDLLQSSSALCQSRRSPAAFTRAHLRRS